MHISHILEADIIPIGKNIKKDANRTYTAGPSGFPAGSFADQIAMFLRKGKKEIVPVAAPAQIKILKRVSEIKLQNMIKAKFPILEPLSGFLEVFNRRTDDGHLGVYVNIYSHVFKDELFKNDKVEQISNTAITNAIEQTVAEIFGDLCIRIDRRGAMGIAEYVLDANKLGLPAVKPSLHSTIDKIFKEFKITGLGFTWTDKLSTGYRTKIEGMELVDSQTFAHLIQRFKTEFGADLIKVTNDKEISRIGHRSVMKGLTNYRLFFGPGIKDKYRQ